MGMNSPRNGRVVIFLVVVMLAINGVVGLRDMMAKEWTFHPDSSSYTIKVSET